MPGSFRERSRELVGTVRASEHSVHGQPAVLIAERGEAATGRGHGGVPHVRGVEGNYEVHLIAALIAFAFAGRPMKSGS